MAVPRAFDLSLPGGSTPTLIHLLRKQDRLEVADHEPLELLDDQANPPDS